MNTRFYVTIIRNEGTQHQKAGKLLGPYDTKDQAEERVPDAKRLAHQADPFSSFDAFGVSSWALPESTTDWPAGMLNRLLEAEQPVAQ
jgi:hypothetical protein